MDTLVDEAEQGQVGDRARARPSSHGRAHAPAHRPPPLPPIARPEAMRPSLATLDPDAQVQWFERPPRPAFDVDLDFDVDLTFDAAIELSLDASLEAAAADLEDSEIDVPTCVWRRKIWTSED